VSESNAADDTTAVGPDRDWAGEPERRPAEARQSSDHDAGGDPACWASRVCPHCGLFVPHEPPILCPRCGTMIGVD